jgi:hypothetical protein
MQRPGGVTAIAILDFIGAGTLLLFAIGAFVGGTFLGTIVGRAVSQSGSGTAGAGLGMLIGAFLGVGCLIFAAVDAALGWGMWTLKEWARIVQIIFAGFGALMQLLGVLTSLSHGRAMGIAWNLIWLGVSGFIIYYLMQPQVKAAFGQQQLHAYVPPPTPPAVS